MKFGANPTVIEAASLCYKEAVARLLQHWRDAVHATGEDPEPVHQLRVATRQLAALLDLFADFLPRRRTNQMRRDLKHIRRSAALSRNTDVFRERFAGKADAGPWRAGLVAHEIRGREQLQACYEEFQHGELLERRAVRLLSRLRPRGTQSRRAAHALARWAPQQLRSSSQLFFRHTRQRQRNLKQLHALRIHSKQLRYELEWLRPLWDADSAQQAIGCLKKLGQRLGEINDHATALDEIDGWRKNATTGEAARQLADWRRQEKQSLRRAVAEFDAWWTAKRRRRLRKSVRNLRLTRDSEGQP